MNDLGASVQVLGKRPEDFAAVWSNHDVVLDPIATAGFEVDAGLHGGHHARLKWGQRTRGEFRSSFVVSETHSVSRNVRKRVSIAVVPDYGPGSGIHLFTGHS
jgi:hypothetical protein